MKQRGASLRQLVLLTGGVLAVHLALLQAAPPSFFPSREASVQHFVARAIPAPPAPAPAAAPMQLPAPSVAAVPAAPRPARPRPPEPKPTAGPEPAPPAQAAAAVPARPAPVLRTDAPEPSDLSGGGAPPLPRGLALPEPARMHYEVTLTTRGFTLQGEARLDWRQDGQEYDAQLEITSPGLRSRVQRSVGRITDQGLAPAYFSDRSRTEQATHFERDQGRLVFSNNSPAAPWTEGMQDRLSVVVQLSMLVGGQPASYPPGTQITIPTAGTRDAENWTFSVEGEEDVQLPAGTLRALKLQRLPRKEYDQKVELWLAPGMDYAPVRLRLTNPNGDGVDQRWSSTDRG